MTVIDHPDGDYAVIDDNGNLVKRFRTNSEAWRWIDRLNGDPVSRAENVSEWINSKD